MDLYKKQFIIFNFRFGFSLPVQSSPEIIIWENFLITTSLTFIIKYGIHCNTFVTTFLHNPSKWILWKLAFSKLTWSYIQYSVKWSIWYGRLKEDGLSSNWTTWDKITRIFFCSCSVLVLGVRNIFCSRLMTVMKT